MIRSGIAVGFGGCVTRTCSGTSRLGPSVRQLLQRPAGKDIGPDGPQTKRDQIGSGKPQGGPALVLCEGSVAVRTGPAYEPFAGLRIIVGYG